MDKDTKTIPSNPDMEFQVSTAAADIGYLLIEKACFLFLAVTTGVMSYNSFNGMIASYVPANLYIITIAFVVGGIYLVIDHNLSGNIKKYWEFKDKTTNKEFKNTEKVQTFLKYSFFLILIRFALTITASWWSADEVSDMTTTKNDPTLYLTEISKHDSLANNKQNSAELELKELRRTEAQRIHAAKREGSKLVSKAVSSGSIHQVSMWERKPVFFDALSPSSKYYRQNKAYADKVHSAQYDSAQLVKTEIQRTKNAENLFYGVTDDTSGVSLTASLAQAIEIDNSTYLDQKERRKNFVLRLDLVCAVVGFMVMRIRFLRKQAGGIEEMKKSFSFIVANFLRQLHLLILSKLELFLNIDIDGDGGTGTVGGVSPTPSTSKGWLSWLKATDKTPPSKSKTTGATARATVPKGTATTAARDTATTDALVKSDTATTKKVDTVEKRTVIKGFQVDKEEDTVTTTEPATPVPTGVSAGYDKPATTATAATTKEVVVKLIHGVGYVIHNGKRRDESWVRKQLRSYKTRQKGYIKKGSDTTVVNANIKLFEQYIQQIEELTREST